MPPWLGNSPLRYFLDTEFNGFGGPLLSLALVREDGHSLYLLYDPGEVIDPWVAVHVEPHLRAVPNDVEVREVGQIDGARAIAGFLFGDPDPEIIADWPDDVRLFCAALMFSPGRKAPVDRLRFDIRRVFSYPTDVAGAVEHNAWWDAMALRRRLMRHEMTDG